MDKKIQEFESIFENIKEKRFTEDIKDHKQIIQNFLLPDNINPKLFYANLQYLEVGIMELYEGEYEPTTNIEEYGFITHRPFGYPLWFLAAYPDVTRWLSNEIENDDKILYKATGKSEEYFNDDSNFINNRFEYEILRKLIIFYKSRSGSNLETTRESKKTDTILGSKMADSMLPDDLKIDILDNEVEKLIEHFDFQGAVNKLSKAIEISSSVELYYKRGSVYFNMELYQNALNDFDKAIQLSPNFREAYVWRGGIKIKLFNDQKGAMLDLKHAADLGDPKAKEMYNKLSKNI